MTQLSIQSLILSAVRGIDPERLGKAVCGLADGSLTVTFTRSTEAKIRALVKNGDGIEYEVSLTPQRSFCTCPDSRLRHSVCKHGIAVALRTLQTPQQPKEQPTIKPFTTDLFHLKWSDGETLCRAPRHEKSWFGWTPYMTTWPEACPTCVAVYKQPKTRLTVAA